MKRLPKFCLISCSVILAVIWGMAIWALNLKEFEAPDMVIFLGRFHPLVLHLPIGFMVLAMALDLGQFLPKDVRQKIPKSLFLHSLVVVTSTFAVFHGILLFAGEGFEDSLLAKRHLKGGCIFLTLCVGVFLVKIFYEHKSFSRLLVGGLSLTSFIVMSISAHDGASLTHGENYLSQYAPEGLKPILEPGYEPKEEAPKPAGIESTQIYTGVVQPIFDRTCVECHKESKKKGKLRMDSYEELAKGGASGDTFEPGNPEDSILLEVLYLPLDDDEHMPPEGKKQLTPEETVLLEWWIKIGAPSEGKLKTFSPTPEIISAVKTVVK